jgi:ABC-type Fe3+-hydroxamate transport system substrate-binding protein
VEIGGMKKEDENRRRCEVGMRRILSIVLAIVLLASAVSLAITPAAAISEVYEEKIPFAGEDNELTKDELVNAAILPYMLCEEGGVNLKLDDVGDAAYVYAYWDGKPKTIMDNLDRDITFYRPVERIVTTFPAVCRVIVELGGLDKLVGVSTSMGKFNPNLMEQIAYPQLKELPGVGLKEKTHLEQVVALKPDVVLCTTSLVTVKSVQEKTDIPAVGLSTSYPYEDKGCAFDGYRLGGKLIRKEERAEELISFINEEFDKILAVTSEIPDSERVRVYYMGWGKITRPHMTEYSQIEIAGGINVAAGSGFGWRAETTKEQVIDWNPDIILMHAGSGKSHFRGLLIEDILLDPDLQTINAVKNGTVYYSKGGYIGRNPATGATEVPYMAKLFYPDKFKDLDVEKEGNRILREFYGVDGLYTWMQENCDLYKWE